MEKIDRAEELTAVEESFDAEPETFGSTGLAFEDQQNRELTERLRNAQ